MTTFNIYSGKVYGRLWGGGEGAYDCTKEYGFKTRAALVKKAREMLKTGALDSGMGYESLIGALLVIEKVETLTVKGKQFSRSEYEDIFIGKLTEKQRDFLDGVSHF